MQDIPALITEFKEIGRPESYLPGREFIRQGRPAQKIAFVTKGLFRYVYLTEEGKEFTKVFMPEGSFISSYSAMISGSSSPYGIEAIELSEVVALEYGHWQELRGQDPKWDKLLLYLLEKGYGIKEKREREFLLLDAESRYRIFLSEFPGLEKRVKQHMVASYLGITPIALSRIRKKMGRINLG